MKLGNIIYDLLRPWETVRRVKRIDARSEEIHPRLHWLAAHAAAISNEIADARMDNLFLTGQIAARTTPATIQSLHEAEFHVFSQFGEDGIIQFLIRALGDKIDHSFIEFGVQDYLESNTLFLLMNNAWRSLVLDGEQRYIDGIKKRDFGWKYGLKSRCAFVSRENINEIFAEEGFSQELGLLSIDVDGIDWYLWEALTVVKPAIIISEYNRHFPLDRPVTIPYEPIFDRTAKHPSNRYYGTSIGALYHLAKQKGYTFVGTESHGRNAFFVRDDLADGLPHSVPSERDTHREARKTAQMLAGLPVYNVETQQTEKL